MPEGTDPSSAVQATGGVVVPLAMREKYPELVGLIMASESMNDGERQYWIDILPVMSGEQTTQLQKILQNERDQLAAIDAKYGKQIGEIAEQKRPLLEIETARHAKAEEREQKEAQAESQEEKTAEDILRKIEEL